MAQDTSAFKRETYIAGGNDTLPYRLFIPEIIHGKSYPLVVFLHGSGERGNDNQKQLIHGVWNFSLSQNQKNHPCFVLAPQCPADKQWVEMGFHDESGKQPDKIALPLQLVMDLVDSLSVRFPVDKQKIYITGLSMGGFGTWDLATRFPQFFAAAIPVCGGGDEDQAYRLKFMPVWAFHGKLDNSVLPERTENMIKAIQKAGGHPKMTEYPNVGHDCWVQAYSDQNMFRWLFAQKRPSR